ncbi:proliferating cell nuclear antigen, N-terminal domain-containing protein [Cladochytrium replicatum]|nr:proliferating cell nuclear antigen, N-terminal domain-containing protein [Cladochytrium replicatum]
MFEARLNEAALLKKILDAIKELVTEANFECNETGLQMQAMDNSHVALVSLLLRASGFDTYRADRSLNLGVNLQSLGKIMKTAGNDDILTIRSDDQGDALGLMFESQSQDRVSEWELKLMDIDSEHLGIPDTPYECTVTMSSTEFQRICRDLLVLGESVQIDCNKEGLRFSATGDVGNGSVTLKPGTKAADDKTVTTTIEVVTPVSLTFSLKYLVNFAKATPLSPTVQLCMSSAAPLLVEYQAAENGYIRYYLAPKIGDDN